MDVKFGLLLHASFCADGLWSCQNFFATGTRSAPEAASLRFSRLDNCSSVQKRKRSKLFSFLPQRLHVSDAAMLCKAELSRGSEASDAKQTAPPGGWAGEKLLLSALRAHSSTVFEPPRSAEQH